MKGVTPRESSPRRQRGQHHREVAAPWLAAGDAFTFPARELTPLRKPGKERRDAGPGGDHLEPDRTGSRLDTKRARPRPSASADGRSRRALSRAGRGARGLLRGKAELCGWEGHRLTRGDPAPSQSLGALTALIPPFTGVPGICGPHGAPQRTCRHRTLSSRSAARIRPPDRCRGEGSLRTVGRSLLSGNGRRRRS